jgi:hypothetical protein
MQQQQQQQQLPTKKVSNNRRRGSTTDKLPWSEGKTSFYFLWLFLLQVLISSLFYSAKTHRYNNNQTQN